MGDGGEHWFKNAMVDTQLEHVSFPFMTSKGTVRVASRRLSN